MRVIALLSALAALGAAPAEAAPDLANGKRVFTTCSYCHGEGGVGGSVGPTLKGIVGRKAGSEAGFAYSDAMQNSGITWTNEELTAFLAKPMVYIKGTRMIYPGIPNRKDEQDVIAYLKTLK